jgi:sugar phosphate isomerase/epimerase
METRVKIGLYSITYLGLWYDGPALTLSELIDRAELFGYEGVEIDGKAPHGNPANVPPSLCRELRAKAQGKGIDIYAVAANNDFSSPVEEYRESQMLFVRDLLRMTADFGAPTMRMFAAWPGVCKTAKGASYVAAERVWGDTHKGESSEQIWDRCRACLVEAAQWASDAGIVLALQNHPEVINNYGDLVRMVSEVNSPALKACLDAPLAKRQRAHMREAARAVRGLQVLTHFGGEYEEGPDGQVTGYVRSRDGSYTPEDFYGEFTKGMLEIGYDGYTGYELCHPLPPINHQRAGIDFADKNARLAAKFMRKILAEASREAIQAAS